MIAENTKNFFYRLSPFSSIVEKYSFCTKITWAYSQHIVHSCPLGLFRLSSGRVYTSSVALWRVLWAVSSFSETLCRKFLHVVSVCSLHSKISLVDLSLDHVFLRILITWLCFCEALLSELDDNVIFLPLKVTCREESFFFSEVQ